MKAIPVQKLTETNREQLEFVLAWHEDQLSRISPKNKYEAPRIPRHMQIVADLKAELNIGEN